MPLDIKGYRVFIASPGGLADERRAFRDTLIEYNEAEAIYRNVQFYPIGWEDTLGGVGRPQSLINEELLECDFFVLLLWDRWGSDPGGDKLYSSGTEEEYHLALECLHDPVRPMRQMLVFFKAVDPRHLSDPGPQLTKVLEFKRTLEKEKRHLYQTFDALDAFQTLLRRHRGAWLRGDVPPVAASADLATAPEIAVGRGAEVNELVREARRLVDEGKRTDAEALFARATVGRNDPDALIAYARFLYQDGRLEQAAALLEHAVEGARTAGSPSSETVALRAMGNVLREQGDLAGAEEMHRKALEIDERFGRLEGQAIAFGNLADVLFMKGDFEGAEQMYQKALELNKRLGRPVGEADVYGNLGVVYHTRGILQEAEQMYRKALEIEQSLGRLKEQANLFVRLGLVLHGLGDFEGADQNYRRALDLAKQLEDSRTIDFTTAALRRVRRAKRLALSDATAPTNPKQRGKNSKQ